MIISPKLHDVLSGNYLRGTLLTDVSKLVTINIDSSQNFSPIVQVKLSNLIIHIMLIIRNEEN